MRLPPISLATARALGSRSTVRDVAETTLTAAIEVLNRSGGGVGSPDQARVNNLKFARARLEAETARTAVDTGNTA